MDSVSVCHCYNSSFWFIADTARTDIRRHYEGMGIKPFSSASFKPLGMTMPQVTLPSAGTRLVHAQKPIAITTPQPHNTSVNTSKQSDTHTSASSARTINDIQPGSYQNTITSQSFRREPCSQTLNTQNIPYSQPGFIVSRPGSGHGMVTSFSAAIDNAVERYVIRRPEGNTNFQENTNSNLMKLDTQLGFACPTCPKVFKSKAAMKLHMTVHKTSEERQFVCPICQRRFLHRHHLIVHQRKHSGEKPYSCNACSKSFMAVFLLHKHLRKHLREQGHSTEISSEQLKQLSGRRRSTSRSDGHESVYVNTDRNRQDFVVVSDDEGTSVSIRTDSEDKRHSEEQNVFCLDNNVRSESVYSSNLTAKSQASETTSEYIPKPKTEMKSEELSSVNANVEITNIEIKSNSVKILASSVKESDSSGVKTKLVIKEIEYDTTFNPEKVNDSSDVRMKATLSKSEDTCNINIDDKISIPDTLSCKEGIIQDFIAKPVPMDKQFKNIEPVDPWPKYTSDDETELDFLTGELRIINRAGVKPETTTALETSSDNEKSCLGTRDKPGFHDMKQVGDIKKDTFSPVGQVEQNTVHEQIKVDANRDKRSLEVLESDISVDKYIVKHFKADDTVSKEAGDKIVDCNTSSVSLKIQQIHPSPSCRNSKIRRNKGHKKVKRFKCESCTRTFFSQHHLLLHMNTHKKKPALDYLKRAKANQINVALTLKSGFVCSVCSRGFKMKKGLNSHMRVHSSKLAENKLISQRFRDFLKTEGPCTNSEADVENLISSHTSVESQEGIIAGGNISNEKTLKSDSNNTADTVVETDQPGMSYSEERFQVIIGKDNIKRYVCHACDNTYTTKQKLKMHALIHKDNCYLCELCGKSFFREATLEKHVGTHMLPRPHVCSVCKKTFIHRSSLMRHKSVHETHSVSAVKQQPQDVKFELEMLDTYAMLRKERLEKLQKEKMDELKIEAPISNLDVMDLSVPRRNELTPPKRDEHLQPPKLSPMITANQTLPSNASVISLSPPNITKEPCPVEHLDNKAIKVEPEPLIANDESKLAGLGKRPRSARIKQEKQSSTEEEITTRTRRKRRKTRVYPTSCRICKDVFPNVMGLKTHMAVHNAVETHLYECNVCGHRFTQSCSLLRHLKTSCGEGYNKGNKLQCNTCEKVFQRRNAYDRHMDTHVNGEPPRLNMTLINKLDEEVDSGGVFNAGPSAAQIELKEEVKSETNEINDIKENDVQDVPTNQTDNSEVSEAETIPYGKTSSDESDDGFSDCSDNTETDEEQSQTLSHPPSNTSLNLLSEVCSSLINLEKEAEMKKQNELISVEKELETIDILARLSRQNASQRIRSESQAYGQVGPVNAVITASVSDSYSAEQKSDTFVVKTEPTDEEETKREVKEDEQKSAKIPTVVMDIESEAEKRHKNFFVRMQQRILEGSPRPEPSLPSAITTAQRNPAFKSNSLLAAALFDKGKPEPMPRHSHTFISPTNAMFADMMPTDLSMKKKTVPIIPLNHSPRSSPSLKQSLLSTSTSSAVLQPPPLVPVFKCPNCEMLLYNKIEYRHHMRGHGISPPDSPQQSPLPQQGPVRHTPGVDGNKETTVGTIDLTTDSDKAKGELSWNMSINDPTSLNLKQSRTAS